jgi:serine/threonine-protein kinase
MNTEKSLVFGNYHVLNLIGKGGMAKVYRCIDTRSNEIYAIKVFTQTAQADQTTLRRFEREIQAMRQVSHPYIVPLLDYALSPDCSYLIMPYFVGGSVADRLMNRLYAPREAAQLLSHLAFALDYAHSQGYIHCDLKPSNLLLDGRGQTYLSDFGLAQAIAGGGGEAQVSGTSPYLAPELTAGARADVRTDVYALGVILYEMLSGHRPFETDSPLTFAYYHRRAMPPAPSQLNAGVPEVQDEVSMGALAKLPADRPQSAGEMAQRFSVAVAQLPEALQTRRAKITPRPDVVLAPVEVEIESVHEDPTIPARTRTAVSPVVRKPARPRHDLWFWLFAGVLALLALGLALQILLALARR